jgi:hypothetical protein
MVDASRLCHVRQDYSGLERILVESVRDDR